MLLVLTVLAHNNQESQITFLLCSAIPPLTNLLSSADTSIRQNAFASLLCLTQNESIKPLIVKYIERTEY